MTGPLHHKSKNQPEDQQTAGSRALVETYYKQVDFVDFASLDPIVRALEPWRLNGPEVRLRVA